MRVMTKAALSGFVLGGLLSANALQSNPSGCGDRISEEYEQVLDAYFARVRGHSSSAIILPVYGGMLPEYEIVLDSDSPAGTIIRCDGRRHSLYENRVQNLR